MPKKQNEVTMKTSIYSDVVGIHATALRDMQEQDLKMRQELFQTQLDLDFYSAKFNHDIAILAEQLKSEQKMPIETARAFVEETRRKNPNNDELTLEVIKLEDKVRNLKLAIDQNSILAEQANIRLKLALLEFEYGVAQRKQPIHIRVGSPN